MASVWGTLACTQACTHTHTHARTHVESESPLLFLPDGCVDPDQHSVLVRVLHVVKLPHDERQEVGGHDGGPGEINRFEAPLDLLCLRDVLKRLSERGGGGGGGEEREGWQSGHVCMHVCVHIN